MPKKYYITTPIYYVNDVPHIGHAYTSVATDCLARFKKMEGFDVRFQTGTDEHGLKIQKAADKLNVTPIELCDKNSKVFEDLTKTLNLSNNDFIRTTETRHIEVLKIYGVSSKKTIKFIWMNMKDGIRLMMKLFIMKRI